MEQLLNSIANAKDVLTLALLMLVLFITATVFLFRYFTVEMLRKEQLFLAELGKKDAEIKDLHRIQREAYETFTKILLEAQENFLTELKKIEETNNHHFTEIKGNLTTLVSLLPKRRTD